jgi:hypothetical protein
MKSASCVQDHGARNQTERGSEPKKSPENNVRFRGLQVESDSQEPASFFYPDYTVGPGVPPDHAFGVERLAVLKGAGSFTPQLVGCTTDREFITPEAPCHPAPKVYYLIGAIISRLRFDDAIDRADAHALWGVIVPNAFDTGGLVDDVQDPIAFTDGFGRAFRYACTTGDAVFLNFHGHGRFSVKRFCTELKLSYAMACVN